MSLDVFVGYVFFLQDLLYTDHQVLHHLLFNRGASRLDGLVELGFGSGVSLIKH